MVRVTFDIDGVIIPLVETICIENGIDINKITEYNFKNNDLLNRDEKNTLYSVIKDTEVFKRAGVYKGVDKLESIARQCDLVINSKSCTDDIAEFKRELIDKLIPSHGELVLTSYEDGVADKIISKSSIFVEDSIENLIINSKQYTVGLLRTHPWNRKYNLRQYPQLIRTCKIEDEIDYIHKFITIGRV